MPSGPATSSDVFELTRNQREVLSRLQSAGEPLGAYTILDRVKAARTMYPSSVYRALNDLIRLGLVHRIESLGLFIACKHAPCDHQTGFLICNGCQKVVELPLHSNQRALLESFVQDEIRIERVTLEFIGRCRACRPVSTRPKRPSRDDPRALS